MREKLLGTLVFPLGPGAALYLGALLPYGRSEVCSSTGNGSAEPPGGMPVPPPPGAPPPPDLPPGPVVIDDVFTCTVTGPPSWVGPVVIALLVLLPIVVAVVLYRTAVRRAAAEPPELVLPGAPSIWGPLEVSGVLVLAFGGLLLPVVGTVVGYVLVCCSPRWTVREKAIAAALALVPLLLPLSALLIARSSL